MAVSSLLADKGKEVMCPLCMEYLTDPVSVDCGHNFCLDCITDFCEKWEVCGLLKCPVCRTHIQKENFQPNWQLANIVSQLKFLALKEKLCQKHQEKLRLFCREDEQLVCQVCEHSPEHKQHSVVLLEEAAQDYKDKIKAQLKSLEKEREILVPQKLSEEIASQKTLAQIEAEKGKVRSAFEHMHNFLEEIEGFWLAQLGDLEKEIKKKLKDNITRISQEITRMSYLIREMEEQCQQPDSEFLQNIKSTMSRYAKKPVDPVASHIPGLEDRLQSCYQKNCVLEDTMGKFAVWQPDRRLAAPPVPGGCLLAELFATATGQPPPPPKEGWKGQEPAYCHGACPSGLPLSPAPGLPAESVYKGNSEEMNENGHLTDMKKGTGGQGESLEYLKVILDPSTAHPSLLLSDDLKSVRWEDKYQYLPDSPARFESVPCVLGCEKFSSGKHWWEVGMEEEEESATWALGVAKESVARKKEICVGVDDGIFAVGKTSVLLPCQLSAFTFPKTTPLILRHPLRKIRVSLDYEEGQVEFYNAETNDWIFTFYSASFSGERICPYFWLGRGVRLKC
ncbi:E3 ubiquitin-protein ligase TRIM58-like [Sphaerodactylus townsendi]|nr:E3 ubiquitin-protein ligase TRIM58-like [Sphaerodactylus townsendi]